MSGLALRVLHGFDATVAMARARHLGTAQGRHIVMDEHGGQPTIGVYDRLAQQLVVFDGAALVALASAEPKPPPAPAPATPWVLTPPSRL